MQYNKKNIKANFKTVCGEDFFFPTMDKVNPVGQELIRDIVTYVTNNPTYGNMFLDAIVALSMLVPERYITAEVYSHPYFDEASVQRSLEMITPRQKSVLEYRINKDTCPAHTRQALKMRTDNQVYVDCWDAIYAIRAYLLYSEEIEKYLAGEISDEEITTEMIGFRPSTYTDLIRLGFTNLRQLKLIKSSKEWAKVANLFKKIPHIKERLSFFGVELTDDEARNGGYLVSGGAFTEVFLGGCAGERVFVESAELLMDVHTYSIQKYLRVYAPDRETFLKDAVRKYGKKSPTAARKKIIPEDPYKWENNNNCYTRLFRKGDKENPIFWIKHDTKDKPEISFKYYVKQRSSDVHVGPVDIYKALVFKGELTPNLARINFSVHPSKVKLVTENDLKWREKNDI